MNAYAPRDATSVVIVAVGLLVALVAGFAISRLRSLRAARSAAWLMAVTGVAGVERLTASEPPGLRMLAIVAVLLYCMKAVVLVEARAADNTSLGWSNWFGFAALWFGMRPALFAGAPGPPRDGAAALFWRGVRRLAAGALLVLLARLSWTAPSEWLSELARRGLATVLLLPGLSLILHFGLFNMIAAGWRSRGAKCRPLFRAPLYSKSLSEFWGQRWNLAFSEMTALAVFRPLRTHIGPRVATSIAFLFSGLLHELAISVPVQAGFGLPTLYFALHALAMAIEKRLERTGGSIQSVAWVGRLWTMCWILLPLPILFHRPFLNGCIWPLIGIPPS